ncbi:MAG: redoxin domain-containing protein [Planctomycetota bacterium]
MTRRRATTLKKGQRAPEFMLPDYRGVPFVLHECLQDGPALLVFFKADCATSRYLLGLLQRMYRKYTDRPGLSDETFHCVGVSLDDVEATTKLAEELDLEFPLAVESEARDASRAYGVARVPAAILVETDGLVAIRSEGFVKADFLEFGRRWAETNEVMPYRIFTPGEQVPETLSATPIKLEP